MEKTPARWMEAGAAKLGGQPLMERMILELVDSRAGWNMVALARYGLLVNIRIVTLVEQPVIVYLHNPHRSRVAMKFKMAPRLFGVEKPAEGKLLLA